MPRTTQSPQAAANRLLSNVEAVMTTNQLVGVGIDLVDATEMRDLIAAGGSALLADNWSPEELNETFENPRLLAGRWAAKEAVMKAMRHGLGEVSPLEFETHAISPEQLRIHLTGSAAALAARAGIIDWHLSVAYDSTWAVGLAVAIGHGRRTSANARVRWRNNV